MRERNMASKMSHISGPREPSRGLSEGLGLVPPEVFLTDVNRKLRTAQTLLDLNGRFGS